MLDLPALDVAIGLVFVYFILALICSVVNEGIASFLRWRAKDLERGIAQLLGTDVLRFKEHPLIAGQIDPKRGFPSYLSSRSFANALLGLGYTLDHLQGAERTIEASIAAIDDPELKNTLTALYNSAQRDAVKFRRDVERWYDDAMERVSGWYRRRVQKVLLVLALLVAVVLNADSLRMAQSLWKDPSVRSALVQQAQNAETNKPSGQKKDAVQRLKALPVPLGWHWTNKSSDPQSFPFWRSFDFFSKLIGLLLTAAALTLGAPFWFDTLSKLARLRNSGTPPPASDSVRSGDADQKRAGPGAVLRDPEPATRLRAWPAQTSSGTASPTSRRRRGSTRPTVRRRRRSSASRSSTSSSSA